MERKTSKAIKSVKAEVKKQYAEIDEILSNSDTLTCFTDKKERTVEAITLENFSKFMSNIMIINVDALWVNYLQEDTEEAVKTVIQMSFPKDKDIMNVITAKNFPEIMKKILSVNDIKISNDEDKDDDEKKRG